MVNENLPDGWAKTTIGEVTDNFDGKRIPVKASDREKVSGIYPYYGASGIIDHVNEYIFDGNYLLIAEDGANLLSRSTPIAFQAQGKFWVNNHAHIVRTVNGCLQKFLEYYLNFIDLKFYVTGTAQPKLTQNNLKKIPVPLPPLPQQEHIIAKIEELFTQLDAGTAALKRVQVGLKRYKTSVLKAAVEGRLFENGEIENSSELPDSWEWKKIKDIAFVTKLAGFEFTKHVTYKDIGDTPVIRAQNVTKENGFIERNFFYVDKNLLKLLPRSRLHGGEVLMVFVGAGLGNVGIVPNGKDYFLGPNVALIRCNSNDIDNKYLYHFLQSDLGKNHVQGFSKSTAQGSISMGNIRDVMVPLPPLAEQRLIVAEVERRLEGAAQVESALAVAVARASRLRQAVLKSAFEGRLV